MTHYIPNLSRSELHKLGYLTRCKVKLPTLDLLVNLGRHFYRDDGSELDIGSLYTLTLNTCSEWGFPKPFLKKKYAYLKYHDFGAQVLVTRTHPQRHEIALAKAVAKQPNETQRQYTEAHEEAHVVDVLGKQRVLRNWLKKRGFPHSLPKNSKNAKSLEFVATTIGLVHIVSEGLNVDEIVPRSGAESMMYYVRYSLGI